MSVSLSVGVCLCVSVCVVSASAFGGPIAGITILRESHGVGTENRV